MGIRLSAVSAGLILGGLAEASVVDIVYEASTLVAPDAGASDLFGSGVAVSGGTAVVSAPQDDDGGDQAGAAWVYLRDSSGWTPVQKIVPPSGTTVVGYGNQVRMSGDTLVVSATFDSGSDVYGAVYVHTRDGGAWSHAATVWSADGADEDFFGTSIAVSGSTIAVGAARVTGMGTETGACHVYTIDGDDCVEVAELSPSDGTDADAFGQAVAVSGDLLAVGAPGADAVYVYRDQGGLWTEEARLEAPGALIGARFGERVAVDGDRVLVGVYRDDSLGSLAGQVVLYTWGGGGWPLEATLTATDGEAGDQFGESVAIEGDTLVIGANKDADQGASAGAAYVFRYEDGAWLEQAKLLSSTGAAYDRFGEVSVSGDQVLVGAPYADPGGLNTGAAFTYVIPSACPADIDGDGEVSIADVLAVIDAWGPCGVCYPDLNADGVVDIDDLLETMSSWGACP